METDGQYFKMTHAKSLLCLLLLASLLSVHSPDAKAESNEFDEEMPDIELSEEVDPFAQMLNDDLVYKVTVGTPEEVKTLLEQGAEPSAMNDEGQTVLGMAAEREDEYGKAVMELLIEAGADLNTKNTLGDAPIHSAIKFNRPESIWLLLHKGADYHLLNEDKKSPRDLALEYGNPDIIAMIDEAIRIEQEREAQKHSNENFMFMLHNFAYYHCAQAYNRYYVESEQDDARYRPEFQPEIFSKRTNEINEYRAKILTIFSDKISAKSLDMLAAGAHQYIYEEMDLLVSNRYRKKIGVGTPEDLQKRCTKIADTMEIISKEEARKRRAQRR